MSLDLLGRSLLELGGTELQSLHLLEAGKTAVDLHDLLVNGLVDQLLGGARGKLLVVGVRHHGQDHLVAVLRLAADDHALGNGLDALQILLDLLGEYVLTVLHHGPYEIRHRAGER